jgi:hypothetical protein
MSESLINDPRLARAVSNITARSERQPDAEVLQETYVETGVLPQVANFGNQILYGRRGTGKTHVLQVLGADRAAEANSFVIYVDMRLLGSAHLFTDTSRPAADRCVAVFKDLLAIIQGRLLDIVTDPGRDGSGLEEVSLFADFITAKTVEVTKRSVRQSRESTEKSEADIGVKLSPTSVGLDARISAGSGSSSEQEVSYSEALRETIVFSELYQVLDKALVAMRVEHLTVLIDEWTSLPSDLQPFIAEFLKRSVFPSNRVTVKIASLEYRSKFSLPVDGGSVVGFELGPDITANLDLDDYYVYERNPNQVEGIFQELLYKHISSGLDAETLEKHGIRDATSFRSRLFTEKATFVELVRAGEGVVRDFLGIFSAAFFKAKSAGRQKIDLRSVEEAARDWYETDKSTSLSDQQRDALHRIITDVIGTRQTKMFMLSREHSGNPMIQSLFDLRLIHLISRGYSDKENPGQRYNIYALDYGTYVDLKRTKSEPDDFQLERAGTGSAGLNGGQHEERIVPFADKRSIRRVILHPSTFDDLA